MAFLNQWQKNRFQIQLKSFSANLIISLIIIGLLSWGLYASFRQQKLNELRAVFNRNLDLGEFYLSTELQKLTRDLEYLSSSPIVVQFAAQPDGTLKEHITSRFKTFARLNASYDQIRILNLSGREILRVNYADAKATEVASDQLQDKSGRYYFNQVLSLPPGHVYISPLDLNIEQLQVERPFKPVIRVATKLTDKQGRTTGIMILNYLAARLFSGLDEVRISRNGQFLLLNQDGFYLKAADPEYEWGHILEDRHAFSLENEVPPFWQRIQANQHGFYDSQNILAGYRRLNTSSLVYNPKTHKLIPPAMSRQWILIDQIPAETLSLMIIPYKNSLFAGAAILTILCTIGSFFISMAISQRNRSSLMSRQLVAILDECPVGLAISDRRGRIQYANRKIIDLSGLSLEQLGSNPLRHIDEQVLPPGNLPEIRSAIDSGRTWSKRFEDPSGELNITRELVISPFENPARRNNELILIMRDVTHEAELEQQLRQSQKLEAVGQLGAGIAHDFNNLLQIILGASRALGQKVEAEGKNAQMLQMIVQAADRGAALTRQLLTFTRSSTGIHRELYFPDQQIEDSLQMLRRLLGEQIQIEFQEGAGNWLICADQNMFEQALINLCINAKDAMPTGGVLTLTTEVLGRKELEMIPPEQCHSEELFHLAIRDNGCGIPKELQKKIFEPFFTTKRSGKGTGLGLASVYNIVLLHDGVINVTSCKGEGSCFDIYLPACRLKSSVSEDNHAACSVNLTGNGECILLAEDDEQVRSIAGMTLEEANYRVIYAENGQQAIELYEQRRDDLRLALLDVIMPFVDGRAVFAHIRSQDKNLPILFVSGHDFNLLKDIGLEGEEQQVISKPFSGETLLQKIAEQLSGRTENA